VNDYTTLTKMGAVHIALITYALPTLFMFRLGALSFALFCLFLIGPFVPPAIWILQILASRRKGTQT
jgi:hypothetical protein